MGIFRRKPKEQPKKQEEKTEHPKTKGKCPMCGSECDVIDYGIFLGYFCMKCGPTTEIKVK